MIDRQTFEKFSEFEFSPNHVQKLETHHCTKPHLDVVSCFSYYPLSRTHENFFINLIIKVAIASK